MKIVTTKQDPKKECAAVNAQEGLITVEDLSLLTGIAVSQLTKFAKIGLLEHYGEYHGRRFYNFQTIANWAVKQGEDNAAKTVILKGMEAESLRADCPYFFEKVTSDKYTPRQLTVSWKTAPVVQPA